MGDYDNPIHTIYSQHTIDPQLNHYHKLTLELSTNEFIDNSDKFGFLSKSSAPKNFLTQDKADYAILD